MEAERNGSSGRPRARPRRSSRSVADVEYASASSFPVGTKISKFFDGYGWFQGKVASVDDLYHRILYSDGDEEDMTVEEVRQHLLQSENEGQPKPKKQRRTITPDIISTHHTKSPRSIRISVDERLWTIQGLIPPVKDAVRTEQEATEIRMQEFLLFCYERQSIWKRRKQGQHCPWSKHESFQDFSYCNVYRELDRGTAFFRAHVLDLYFGKGSVKDAEKLPSMADTEWLTKVLWAAYVYRQVNRVDTFQVRLGYIPSLQQLDAYTKVCQKMTQASESFFTGCHQTTHMGKYLSNIQEVGCENGASLLHETVAGLQETIQKYPSDGEPGGSQAVKILQRLPGIGSFFAWQILCDLAEAHCLPTTWFENFCELGPGARQGLQHIFSHLSKTTANKNNRLYLAAAKQVEEYQSTGFQQLGLTFPVWGYHSSSCSTTKPLGLKEIEHALCEYAKLKAGKTRRRFQSQESLDKYHTRCYACRGTHTVQGLSCNSCRAHWCKKCSEGYGRTNRKIDEMIGWTCDRCMEFENAFSASRPVEAS